MSNIRSMSTVNDLIVSVGVFPLIVAEPSAL